MTALQQVKAFRIRLATPTLDSLARDLTEVAREGLLDPVIGRSKEITRVIEVLARRTKQQPGTYRGTRCW